MLAFRQVRIGIPEGTLPSGGRLVKRLICLIFTADPVIFHWKIRPADANTDLINQCRKGVCYG